MTTLIRIHHLGNTSYGGFIPAQLDTDGDLPKQQKLYLKSAIPIQ